MMAAAKSKDTIRLILPLLALLPAVVTGCVSRIAPGSIRSEEIEEYSAEEYAVYEYALGSLLPPVDGKPNPTVIIDHTEISAPSNESLKETVAYIQQEFGPLVETSTLEEFEARNRRSHELDQESFQDPSYVLISQAEVRDMFDTGAGWRQFYSQHPDAKGITTFSRVGFNEERDQALLYVGIESGERAGIGHYVLLGKEVSTWDIQEIAVAWVY